ncbi:hypothetical protein SISSUDRAFT_1118689 [Sistotremastrum suecicum HHB10207 ss-3]|uniref:Uncharacterized protein n=1 Tax=Sistotremastrum suecicum HHB10207 ss-3 TaxID=1314776 RepID=A0A166ERS3_9AGAM|nr:hypothetical protein SISSUDRAFT_1118689 [Sistotremastrum suecicum HHB10207 ss-3]
MSLRLSPEFVPCASPEELARLDIVPDTVSTANVERNTGERQDAKPETGGPPPADGTSQGTSSNTLSLGIKAATALPKDIPKRKPKNRRAKKKLVHPMRPEPMGDENTVIPSIIGSYYWVFKKVGDQKPVFLDLNTVSPQTTSLTPPRMSHGALTITLRDYTSPIVPSNVVGYFEHEAVKYVITKVEEHDIYVWLRERWTRCWRLVLEHSEPKPHAASTSKPPKHGEINMDVGTPHELLICGLRDSHNTPFVELVLRTKGTKRLVLIGKKFRDNVAPQLSQKEMDELKALTTFVKIGADPKDVSGLDDGGEEEDGPLMITTIPTPPTSPSPLEDGEVDEYTFAGGSAGPSTTSLQKRSREDRSDVHFEQRKIMRTA